jgi:hypothetical protein
LFEARGIGQHLDRFVLVDHHILGTGLYRCIHQCLFVAARGVLQQTHMIEQETNRPVRAQVAGSQP